MDHSIYIVAQRSDWSGPVQKIVEEIYFGPFDVQEEHVRVNDRYAENLEADGLEVYSIAMTDEEAQKYHINPREFWMAQLASLSDIRETTNA